MSPKIVRITPNELDAVVAASHLFDDPVQIQWARKFLESPTHHLLMAYDGETPAGFVSGVDMTHPGKGTEMFLYELGVAENFRGRGIGAALVSALSEVAREAGCYGMWVLTDRLATSYL